MSSTVFTLEMESRMTTFVLVHGAWSGSHGFRHVRSLLLQAGHQVFTPSLTGIGERSHLSSPMVNLTTHIRDVTNQVLYEDLREIVLLGFSYGGFVITGSLEHIESRVRHLVFLDAFVPQNGETVLGHIGHSGRTAAEIGEAWLMPSPERQFDDPEEGNWMRARRGSHPKGCLTEAVYLSRPLEQFEFSRTYVKATLNPKTDVGGDAFWRAAEKAKQSSAWTYKEIETTHMVASNRPVETAAILLDVAKGL
jgi:pimeloyl-ACP methyl ester carboxylesterase